jgi:hypothetical protein
MPALTVICSFTFHQMDSLALDSSSRSEFLLLPAKNITVLRVPRVSELCTNPHINDELTAIYATFEWSSSPTLSKQQAARQQSFLVAVKDMFCSLGISWSLYYGSLLGAFITHDILPWDDDLDIIVKEEDIQLLAKLQSNGTLTARFNVGYVFYQKIHKLYWAPGRKIRTFPWAWPYVDVMGYEEGAKNFKNSDREKSHRFDIDKSFAVPFRMRPFGPIWVPAPHDTWKMMSLTYKKMTQFNVKLLSGTMLKREACTRQRRNVRASMNITDL